MAASELRLSELPLSELPLEIWTNIFRYLPNHDLATFSLASWQLCDEAISQAWRHVHWRLVNAEKILSAVTSLKKKHKRRRIATMTITMEFPLLTRKSERVAVDTINKLCMALDGLVDMGIRVEQVRGASHKIDTTTFLIAFRSLFQ